MKREERKALRLALVNLQRRLLNLATELPQLAQALVLVEGLRLTGTEMAVAQFARRAGKTVLRDIQTVQAAIEIVSEAAGAADEAVLAHSGEPLLKVLDSVEHRLKVLTTGGNRGKEESGEAGAASDELEGSGRPAVGVG